MKNLVGHTKHVEEKRTLAQISTDIYHFSLRSERRRNRRRSDHRSTSTSLRSIAVALTALLHRIIG